LSIQPLSQNIFDQTDLSSYKCYATEKGGELSVGQTGLSVENRRLLTVDGDNVSRLAQQLALSTSFELFRRWKDLSPWSRSGAKRFFDCACVLISLPVLIPVMLAVAAAVKLTSRGPVLFLQERVGRDGRTFTIFKFRTMVHLVNRAQRAITTSDDQRFTLVGPFLRRWKLDEVPQLMNVLLGHMSLVGPRPKVPEHVMFDPPCRPGITGLATIVFACEESDLAGLEKDRLDAYYHSVVLPAKRQLDAVYMARATFVSDFRLLVNSVLRRWDCRALDELIAATALEIEKETARSRASYAPNRMRRMPMTPTPEREMEAEEVSAL
jgi:lipopolysaccharide/colanic/teichoic acid biosynthesis glycosyltransferase